MSVEREERERRREHRARVAIRGGRDEHRGDGAASECLAPIPLRQQGRTGHVAVAVLIVGDVVAGELDPRRRRDRDRPSEVERARGRTGEAAPPPRSPPPSAPPPPPPRPATPPRRP